MARPKITLKQPSPLEQREAVAALKQALAPSSGGPHDPELERLKARVSELEARLNAFIAISRPVTFGGRTVERCTCGKLATRTAGVDHPIQGRDEQPLCDTCEPSGYVATLVALGGKPTVSIQLDSTALEYVRRINAALTLR
jgi:hypothetical protein